MNFKFPKMPKYTDNIGERTLPDIIDYNLDLLFINVNQHHYSGQGNQFCKLKILIVFAT